MILIVVATHGPYTGENFGSIDFSHRLKRTIEQIAIFSRKVKELEPDTVIFVIGDHKPSLNEYFSEQKILSPDDSLVKHGDIPIYVYDPNQERQNTFVHLANQQPLFCASYLINQVLVQAPLASHEFVRQQHLCNQDVIDDIQYQKLKQSFPEWLYNLALFEN